MISSSEGKFACVGGASTSVHLPALVLKVSRGRERNNSFFEVPEKTPQYVPTPPKHLLAFPLSQSFSTTGPCLPLAGKICKLCANSDEKLSMETPTSLSKTLVAGQLTSIINQLHSTLRLVLMDKNKPQHLFSQLV